MLLQGMLLTVAASVVWAEKYYYPQASARTWDGARDYCQLCFKDLVTITTENAQSIVQNLTSDYWIGLRQSFNGSMPWSKWADGAPFSFQNWYPGRPVLKKKVVPVPTCPTPTITPTTNLKSTVFPTHSQYYSPDSSAGFTEGSSAGFTEGSSAGFTEGSSAGFTEGSSAGFTEGSSAGFTEGSSAGFTEGSSTGFTEGSSTGFTQDFTTDSTQGPTTHSIHTSTSKSTSTNRNEEFIQCPALVKLLSCLNESYEMTPRHSSTTVTSGHSVQSSTSHYTSDDTTETNSDDFSEITEDYNFTTEFSNTTVSMTDDFSSPFVTNVPKRVETSAEVTSSNTISPKHSRTSPSTVSTQTSVSTSPSTVSTQTSVSTTSPSTVSTQTSVSTTSPSTVSTQASINTTTHSTSSTTYKNSSTVPTSHSTTEDITTSQTELNTVTSTSVTIQANDTDPDAYIEDSCVALLSFGVWWEKPCYALLPYICYDELFYGHMMTSNTSETGTYVSWSEVTGNITHYRIELTKVSNRKENANLNNTTNINQTTNVTGLGIEYSDLEPGTKYKMEMIPVKCGRDLNPQNIFFYTLPNSISSLAIVKVEMHTVTLNWSAPDGGHDFYLVTVSGNTSQRSYGEEYTVKNLSAGVLYNFTVRAGVNDSTYGQPDSISSYTKPSPVVNLTSENNETDKIFASWSSTDSDTSGYLYHVILNNKSSCNATSMISVTGLEPGSRFNLSVSALANGSLEGEARTISAYTSPLQVSIQSKESTNNSITVSWNINGSKHSSFILKLFSNKNNIINNDETLKMNYTFSNLDAATLYYISIITHVLQANLTSEPVNLTIFTRPVPLEAVNVNYTNTTAVKLQWVVPKLSADALHLTFRVVWFSPFWNKREEKNVTGQNFYIINDLNSGSKYSFSVSILVSQDLESQPVSINASTEANIRRLSLTMMCYSNNQMCMEKMTRNSLLNELNTYIHNTYMDNINWTLKWT